ncbi:MAG TPA: hypothetical protein VNO55_06705 [Polyangia bacterium]|nr:hypothetical protein [Polyangia bacterium]
MNRRFTGFALWVLATARCGGTTLSADAGAGTPPMKHRVSAETCERERAPGACDPSAGGAALSCTADSDCATGTNGRCNTMIMQRGCACTYDRCFSDSDCSTGGPCACRAAGVTNGLLWNGCLAGNCRTDSDCGPGNHCSPTVGFDCGPYTGVVGYYCHHPKDACVNDSDCTKGDCRYDPASGAWACATSTCTG